MEEDCFLVLFSFQVYMDVPPLLPVTIMLQQRLIIKHVLQRQDVILALVKQMVQVLLKMVILILMVYVIL